MIHESELILNGDGSIFHLHLQSEMLADTIFLVGDPARVSLFSGMFDKIEHKVENRELITHTGTYKGKRCSVISTGMGTDNIDIVVNEIDALKNIDLKHRRIKEDKKSVRLIRVGTCGAMQPEVPVASFVASQYALGIDGLMNYYADLERVVDEELTTSFIAQTEWPPHLAHPYIISSSEELFRKLPKEVMAGITATAPGFYAPQGRVLRLPLAYADLNDRLSRFRYNNVKVVNFEMETSAIYGLGKAMGHQVLTICLVIANRIRKEYCQDYKPHMKDLISMVLDLFCK